MSFAMSRPLLRQSRLAGRQIRFESTASSTASKAGEKAKEVQSKASEGLSKVTSAAGPAISGAAAKAGAALNSVGGRTGKAIAFVQSLIPPTVYYAKVGLELGKLMFHGQKMAPPPLTTFQSYFQRIVKSARNPSALLPEGTKPETVLSRVRNMSSAQLAAGGVVFAEILGFFTVGEMIGRMKIVGYRGDVAHAEH